MHSSALYRATATAGFACAVLLLINVFRRAGLLPETTLTHAIAPFGALTGLLAITGLYLLIRGTAGTLGLIGYLLNAAGLAGAYAIEYTLHYVFPFLGGTKVNELLAGGTGQAFLATSVVLLAGVLTFSAAALRAGTLPGLAVVLYATGMIPGALRNMVPLPVYLIGLVVAAAGIAWMSARLWSAQEEPSLLPAGRRMPA
ncbi:hypothetical protein [Nonomuraea aurantiaca]|uniref:hypothetical protein n=1 Tax=Nonomuraea aurantiaca TaxID=2878562 RepID=UPI001CD98FBF|nr:hypothetical protein [Nonomuraea aurantiaca]MCA2227904.1 hypothetical protein [Nonomuraea aurantiaca]